MSETQQSGLVRPVASINQDPDPKTPDGSTTSADGGPAAAANHGDVQHYCSVRLARYSL